MNANATAVKRGIRTMHGALRFCNEADQYLCGCCRGCLYAAVLRSVIFHEIRQNMLSSVTEDKDGFDTGHFGAYGK